MDPRIFAHSYRLHKTGLNPAWRPPKTGKRLKEEVTEPGQPICPPCFLQVGTEMKRQDLTVLYTFCDSLKSLIETSIIPTPFEPEESGSDSEDERRCLRHSCWNIQEDKVTLLHIWSLYRNANNLTNAELILPDKPAYAKFEQLIVEETKDIVIRFARGRSIRSESVAALLAASRYVYLQVTYKVQTKQLAEFQARLEAAVVPFAFQNDWIGGSTYLGVTGRAGLMTQVWMVPEETASVAQGRLASAPWQQLLASTPICQILVPTPMDPLLGKDSPYWSLSARQRRGTQQLARLNHVNP